MTTNKISLESLVLKLGAHKTPEDGLCVMEAVSYFAGEPHSDKPKCACPVLTSFMITLNDNMNETERELLKPYIHKLVGTRDGNSQKRLDILVRASIAVFAADALRVTGLPELIEHADILEKFKDSGTLSETRSAADSAYWAARAAYLAADSAYSESWAAADSAYSAARSAADSADSAAHSAAHSAASSARSAADSAYWAADSAARSAADSAYLAADSAYWAARSAARLKYFKKVLKTLDQTLEVKS